MKTKPLTFLAALAITVAIAGCGGSSSGQTPTVSGAADQKPTISKVSGDPPLSLIQKDIKVGTGPTAELGDTVTVQYVGKSWSTNNEFDASWGKGQPFTFQLGAGKVIPGWDTGVQGMKVGGRRLLIIPPDIGYGAQGQPPAIGPNETLIFVVDLLKVKK